MDFYQVGYYRKGFQGVNSGWDFVAPTDGISQKATSGFRGYVSNIIQDYTIKLYGNPGQYPEQVTSLGVFENYVYLTHFNFTAKGEDPRGVTYAHCYCFTLKNYLEISKTPEKLFGIAANIFPTEYNSAIDEFPLVNSLPYAAKDVSTILNKYGISDDNYRKLLVGVVGALEHLAEPVCIKKADIPFDKYNEFYQDMMYVISMGLPHFLRIKLNGFAAPLGGKFASVFVSNAVETGNYADLDSGVFNLSAEAASKYYFTQLYTDPRFPVKELDKFFAKFFYEVAIDELDDPIKRVDCKFMDHMFLAMKKAAFKEPTELDTEMVLNLLPDFLNYRPVESLKTYEYLTTLLTSIYNQNLQFKNANLLRNLMGMYETSSLSSPQFKEIIEKQVIRFCFEGNTSDSAKLENAFGQFYEIKDHCPKLFDSTYAMLKRVNPNVAFRFYLSKELPKLCTSLKDVQQYLGRMNRNANPAVERAFELELERVVDLFKKYASNEMAASRDEFSFIFTANLVRDIFEFISQMGVYDESRSEELRTFVIRCIWSSFQLEWFTVEDANKYKTIYLVKTFTVFKDDPKQLKKAQNINLLLMLLCKPFSMETVEIGEKLAFSNEFEISDRKKNEILNRTYDTFFEVPNGIPTMFREKAFDLLLAVSYNTANRVFDAGILGERLADWDKEDMFLNGNVECAIRSSRILSNSGFADRLLEDITVYVDENGSRDRGSRQYEIIKGLKKYKTVLEGKELMEDDEVESTDSFLTTMYRGIVGIIGFSALALFAFDVFKYFGLEGTTATILFAVSIALIVICPIVAFILANDMFSDFNLSMAEYGLYDLSKLIIYLSVLFILVIALVFTFILANIWWVSIVVFVCMLLALILMIVRDFIVENR